MAEAMNTSSSESDVLGKRKSPEVAQDKELAREENPRDVKTTRIEPSEGTTDVAEYKTNPKFLATLVHTTCDQLRVPDNTVFCAERTDKVIDVFRGMVKKNFLSVPVLQKTGHKWYGFIDMADIVSFVIESLGADKLQSSEDFWALFDKEDAFRSATVEDLMRHPLTRRNPFSPVQSGYSLYYVIESLARHPELHRVPIIDTDRTLMNLITQSQVAMYLLGNKEHIGTKLQKPLRLVRDAVKPVVKVTEAQPAIDAFSLMVKENISGIAVVTETGGLKGALSVRDLKAVAPDAALFWRMYQPVGSFLNRLNSEYSENRPSTPQSCTVENTIETALTRLVENKIHRVFVVNDRQEPIGVFSLKDLLLEIISP